MAPEHDPLKHEALNGVRLRRMVNEKARTDVEDAYLLAKSIKHPWYRCQSLAAIAEHAKGGFVKKVLRESFESAMKCHDQNRRVSVACWPIRVALERDQVDLAKQFLDDCIHQLNNDIHPISRWCASSVLQAIKKNDDLLHYFFEAFENATSEGHGWKVERNIKGLLDDAYVQKDQRYVDYLRRRADGIEEWKKAHKGRNQS